MLPSPWDLLERGLYSILVRVRRGHTRGMIARDLGLPSSTITGRMTVLRKLGFVWERNQIPDEFDEIDVRLSSLGRCRCGLLLPCNGCLMDTAQSLASRTGDLGSIGKGVNTSDTGNKSTYRRNMRKARERRWDNGTTIG